MIKKVAFFTLCLLLNLTFASIAKAEEIVVEISGNGSNSSNEVQIQSQNTNTVSQENNANLTNNAVTNANTGNNNTNSNTNGDSTILTGDVNATTNVNNQNVNTNIASGENCLCDSSTTVLIIGNGTGSSNTTYIANGHSTIVSQNNTTNIYNNVIVNLNTGYNTASYNSGSAAIITGNIKATTSVNNKNINNSNYLGESIFSSNSSVAIKGNGKDSYNQVVINENNKTNIEVYNLAEILNNVEHNLNTGGNSTIANLGDSVIVTGNIESDIVVNNENINSSYVEIDCECNPDGDTPPTPPTAPTLPGNGSSIVQGASGSSTSSGSSGPAAGSTLPATGSSPFTFYLTLILLCMFLTGLYLRFHSSNAPPATV